MCGESRRDRRDLNVAADQCLDSDRHQIVIEANGRDLDTEVVDGEDRRRMSMTYHGDNGSGRGPA